MANRVESERNNAFAANVKSRRAVSRQRINNIERAVVNTHDGDDMHAAIASRVTGAERQQRRRRPFELPPCAIQEPAEIEPWPLRPRRRRGLRERCEDIADLIVRRAPILRRSVEGTSDPTAADRRAACAQRIRSRVDAAAV